MRSLVTLAALAISTAAPSVGPPTTLVRRAPKPMRTISSLTYLQQYGATDKVSIFRGVPAEIIVKGQFVDLTTGVEVRTSGGAATSDPGAFKHDAHGGDDTHIAVTLTSGDATALGTFRVLLHYAVEVNGPDKFDVRVFDHGKVTTLRIVEPAEPGGAYLTGKSYTLEALGEHLENAALYIAKTGIPGLTVSPSSVVSASLKRFVVRFANAGAFAIKSDAFFDQNLPSPPPTDCPVQCYSGTATLQLQIVAVPVVAAVSATTPAAGTPVSISGTSLTLSGFNSSIIARPRYGLAGSHTSTSTTASGGGLTFAAQPNFRQDSITIEYHAFGATNGLPSTFNVALPRIAVQGGTPVVTQLDSIIVPGTGTSRKVLVGGTRTLLGKFLAPYPLLPLLKLATDPVISPISPSVGTVQLAPSTTLPTQPIVKFGQNDLIVSSSRYFPTAVRANEVGVDSVTFGMINFTDTIAKTLSVATPFGSTSIASVLAIPPPTIAFIRRRFPSGQTTVVSDGVLIRGATYEIGGVALIITSSGVVIHKAAITLNGSPVTAQNPSATTGSLLPFSVPVSATSGTLALETRAGVVSRAVTVQDPPPPVTIAGFQASPASVVGGQPVTGTVAVNATIPAGSSAGALLVTPSVTTPTVLTAPSLVQIRTNPVVIAMSTRVTRTPVTSVITVTNADAAPAAGTANTFTATVNVLPPTPTSVTLSAATVAGGQPVTATIQMNATATLADSIVLTLTTDDPTSITLPASVSLNGSTATVQVATRVVPSTRSVTINASFGGQTRSATFTVTPPTLASVIANPASTVTPSTVPVTITATASLPAAQTAAVTCVGEGLTCPASVSISGTTATFNVTVADVPTARTGTITVTLNGVAKSGTLDMQPLTLTGMIVSPATVAAGTSSSFTLQLNRAPTTTSLTFHFTSSDPTVVPAPADVTFTSSQLTKLVTVNTIAPQGTSKTVTITATATRLSAFGTATITRAATVSVTP